VSEMDEGLRALEATSARLIAAVQDMSLRLNTTEKVQKDLDAQQRALKKQQEATRRQWGINWLLGLSILLDVALSVAVGLGYFRISHNANEIADIQQVTSNEVLCPLYVVFLASVDHPRPEQVDTPEEKAAFEAAARIIRDGYAALGCTS